MLNLERANGRVWLESLIALRRKHASPVRGLPLLADDRKYVTLLLTNRIAA